MQDKIKLIIIIVLMVMLAISALVGVQTYSSKKAIELERNSLRNENSILSKKIDEVSKERRGLQEKVNTLSNDLGKASQEKEEIQKQYEAIMRERENLVAKAESLQKDNNKLRGDLDNLMREKQQLGKNLENNFAPIKQENVQLRQQLDNINTLKDKLETELEQLKGEKSGLEKKLNEIDLFLEQKLSKSKYQSLKEQMGSIRASDKPEVKQAPQPKVQHSEKESVELPAIIVKPQTKEQENASLDKSVSAKPVGSVLEINKENGFVIIDLGQEIGVKPGDVFGVYRKGQDSPIATLGVIQVRQRISACDIKEEAMPIQMGDLVR
ncbi:MAG: hypothetical protein PHW54_05160 [Candidatus Omnitrophica bacterium]|nr:hypothetical protein [Candidatus Omnitrophota bacterium]